MDPVCHTLVGGALAESGLERRTALGAATLLLAANAPDVDVLAYLAGPTTAFSLRRGLTHGVVAWLVLPLLITGGVLLADRVLRRGGDRRRAVPSQVLLLAVVGVATHPLLDLLNTYGVRLLMPFSDRWFYGDVLFIVDPWVWTVLAIGILWTRRRVRAGARDAAGSPAAARPVRWALVVLVLYVAAMAGSNLAARRLVVASLAAEGMPAPDRMMVGPVAVNPLRRKVVVEIDGAYRGGDFSWLGPHRVRLDDLGLRRDPDYRTVAATRGPSAREFLSWARFPFFEVAPGGRDDAVLIGDARYALEAQGSWASVRVPLGGGPGP